MSYLAACFVCKRPTRTHSLDVRATYCKDHVNSTASDWGNRDNQYPDDQGVWRAGCVVWDWDGMVGAWRCEECGSAEWRFRERVIGQATRHARLVHGLKDSIVVEVPDPLEMASRS